MKRKISTILCIVVSIGILTSIFVNYRSNEIPFDDLVNNYEYLTLDQNAYI